MVLRGMLLKKAILFLESHLIEIGTQSIFCVDAPEALFLLTESKYIQSLPADLRSVSIMTWT